MNNDIGKEKIIISFLLYLMYILFVMITEWTNFVSWVICDKNLGFGIAEIFSAVVVIVGFGWLKRFFQVGKVVFDLKLFIGCTVILVFGVMKSAYPDGGFDTFNYHLIAQNPKFENYFLEDFGYGNFQVWGFRLCDRMFYYFRYFLGYRFGTYLNTIVFVIAFIQIYGLLGEIKILLGKNNNALIYKVMSNKLLWSLSILFPLDVLMMYGSYYVDAFAIPLGLEIIRLIIQKCGRQVSTKDIIYFALLNGLWIGMKLTNIIYVIPCVVIYVILHIRNLKIKDWIMALIAGIFPSAEYLIFNYICTKNPVFPYYNSIFKSPYYPIMNFKDNRWGGTNFLEQIFWLWSLAFNPDYRKSEIYDVWNGVLIIGLVGTMIVIICSLVWKIKDKKKLQVQYFSLVLISIFSALLWSFTTGYSRYYMIGRLFWGLLAFWFVAVVARDIKYVGKIVAFVCLVVSVTNTALNVNTILKGKNWSLTNWTWNDFKAQMAVTFRDNDIKNDYKQEADLFVITNQMSMGVAELIDDNIYTININYFGNVSSIDEQSFMAGKIDESKLACDFHARTFWDLQEYVENLNNNNLYVTNIESIDLSIGTYEMFFVENSNERKNTVWTSNNGQLDLDITDIQGEKHLKFIGGRIYDWPADGVKLEINVSDGINERQVAVIHLDNSNINLYDLVLELSEKDSIVNITPYYETNGEIVEPDQIDSAFLINAMVE